MADLTDADLDRLEALAAAATRAPWRVQMATSDDRDNSAVKGGGYLIVEDAPHADCLLIAAAREAVPALVAEVRALRDALDEATAAARRLSTQVDRLESEALEVCEALGLLDDEHASVVAEVRRLRALVG